MPTAGAGRVVDAHAHVWDLTRRPQPWTDAFPVLQRSFALADLRAAQADAGIDRVVLVQCVDDVDETRELLELAATEELVAGVVGWLDLDARGFTDDLDALLAGPGGGALVGLRHQLQVEPDEDWLRRPAVHDALRRLGAAGLTFDLVVSPEQLRSASDVVAGLPGTRFVLDHCGNPPLRSGDLDRWRRDLALVAAAPHAAVKLSGLATHGEWGAATVSDLAPLTDHVLGCFGPDRVMFGSDWPVCLLSTGYGDVVALTEQVTAGLTAEEADAVWSGTATVWYGLTMERTRTTGLTTGPGTGDRHAG